MKNMSYTPKSLFRCKEPLDVISCKLCKADFHQLTDFKRHHHFKRLQREELRYFCATCNFETYSILLIKQHRTKCTEIHKVLRRKEVKWFKCDQCSSKFKLKSHLCRHIYMKHIIEKTRKKQRCDDSRSQYKCKKCRCDFKSEMDFRTHCFYQHTSDEVKWLTYEHCYARLHINSELQDYIEKRRNLYRRFKCAQCDFKCMSFIMLEDHILRKHNIKHIDNRIQWFQCGDCVSRFVSRNDLRSHVHRVHGR